MRRAVQWIGLGLVLLLLAGTASAQGWTAFSPEGGRCKVDMPGTPTVETVPLNSPGQTLSMTEAKVQTGAATFFISWAASRPSPRRGTSSSPSRSCDLRTFLLGC
jgi:hypothetical protein